MSKNDQKREAMLARKHKGNYILFSKSLVLFLSGKQLQYSVGRVVWQLAEQFGHPLRWISFSCFTLFSLV
jgi:hypothetical protein